MDVTEDSEDDNDFKKLRKDLKCEIDVARYYRKLQENIRSHSSRRTPKKQMKSKSTQTDLVPSSFSLLWLMSYQNLMNNLYSGLNSIIRHCEVDASGDVLHQKNKTTNNEYNDGQDFKDPFNSSKQRNQSKDLKQDLSNLLELASTLQNAFVNRIGDEYKALYKKENELCSGEHPSKMDDKRINLLSRNKYWKMQDLDALSSSTENSDDFELIQDFTKPEFSLNKSINLKYSPKESKYFKGYTNKKNRMFEEVTTPRTSCGISVISYHTNPYPRSHFTETNLSKESSPETMISRDNKLNHHTVKRNNKNRMGLVVIGRKIGKPPKGLAEIVDPTTKTSAHKHNLQMDSKNPRDKYKSLNKERVKGKDVKQKRVPFI